MAHHFHFNRVLKSQIFGNHLEQQQLWKLTKLPFLLALPSHLHLRTNNSLAFHRINHPPSTHFPPSFPPCTSYISLATMSSSASSQDSNPNPAKTVRAVIKGRVQGVFYRNWTIENAKDLGLKGWVRNRRDGSVEALFSGSPDKVQEMEQRCRRGPPDALVTKFDVFPSDEDPGTGFDRRPTL